MNNKVLLIMILGLVMPTLMIAAPALKLSSTLKERTGLKTIKIIKTDTISERKNRSSKYARFLAQSVEISDDIHEIIKSEETVSDFSETMTDKSQSIEEFVNKIGEQASKIASYHDLYASVMIAQAILESEAGNSALSIPPYYNLFGIKGDYKGATVVMKTQEDDGQGNLFTIDSKFRQYSSYKESLEDYAMLLKMGVTGNTLYYQSVWKSQTKNYPEATKSLTGKYATDAQYDEKLNRLIEVYQLTKYDIDQQEVLSKLCVFTEITIKDVAVKINAIKRIINTELGAKHKWRIIQQVSKLIRKLFFNVLKVLRY